MYQSIVSLTLLVVFVWSDLLILELIDVKSGKTLYYIDYSRPSRAGQQAQKRSTLSFSKKVGST